MQEFLTSREARALYRVSRATWDRMRWRPGFPLPVRLSARCLRWRISDLLAFAEASKAGKAA